jgi:hypothetical protein
MIAAERPVMSQLKSLAEATGLRRDLSGGKSVAKKPRLSLKN